MTNLNQKARNKDKVVFTSLDFQDAIDYAARQEKKHVDQFVFVNECNPGYNTYYNVYARN